MAVSELPSNPLAVWTVKGNSKEVAQRERERARVRGARELYWEFPYHGVLGVARAQTPNHHTYSTDKMQDKYCCYFRQRHYLDMCMLPTLC